MRDAALLKQGGAQRLRPANEITLECGYCYLTIHTLFEIEVGHMRCAVG